VIPDFNDSGLLPPGIHAAEWGEIATRFGGNGHRRALLRGLRRALDELRRAGCATAYLDGSFVTETGSPNDYDACWSIANVDVNLLDPVLLDLDHGRRGMRAKYMGDLFPAETPEGITGRRFLDFFQIDKQTGNPKGILMIDLRGLP
jgi:hypothetical protein